MTFNLDRGFTSLIKFLCAIIIALHHYSQYLITEGHDSIAVKILSSQGGYLGVALFFFISGYGLMESEKIKHLSLFNFIKKRVAKIYLPVILVSILWLPIFYYVKSEEITTNWFLTIIGDCLFKFNDGVLWFIKALIPLYIAFFIFSEIALRNKKQANLALILLTAVIYIAIYTTIASYTAISIPMFTIGVFTSINKDKPLIFIPVIAVIQFLTLYPESPNLAIHNAINYLFIMSFIILLMVYDIKIPYSKEIVFLGIFSFDIYLVHNKVLYVMKEVGEINIYNFLFITLIIAATFYLFRSKIIKT